MTDKQVKIRKLLDSALNPLAEQLEDTLAWLEREGTDPIAKGLTEEIGNLLERLDDTIGKLADAHKLAPVSPVSQPRSFDP